MEVRVNLNDDGSLDEIVGEGYYHLEQMDNNNWCLWLGETMIYIQSRSKVEAIIVEEPENEYR